MVLSCWSAVAPWLDDTEASWESAVLAAEESPEPRACTTARMSALRCSVLVVDVVEAVVVVLLLDEAALSTVEFRVSRSC